MTFDQHPVEWKNVGVEPPAELRESGFVAGYKPPAGYFNCLFHRIYQAIIELQQKLGSHGHDAATQSKAGFLSAGDKKKLDGLGGSTGTTNYMELENRPNLVKGGRDTYQDRKYDGDVLLSGGVLDITAPRSGETFPEHGMGYHGYGISIGSGFVQSHFEDDFDPLGFLSIGGFRDTQSVKRMVNLLAVGHPWINGDTDVAHCAIIGESNTIYGRVESSLVVGGDDLSNGFKVLGSVRGSILVGGGDPQSSGEAAIDADTTVQRSAIIGYVNHLIGVAKVEDTLLSGFRNGYYNFGQTESDYRDTDITRGCAIGGENQICGEYSIAIGYKLRAKHWNTVVGNYNKEPRGQDDVFIVGVGCNGPSGANGLRVTYDGEVYGMSAFNASGADYAECFEWLDGNPDDEDRRGRFVTLEGECIRLAGPDDDFIAGVVSATPSVVGDHFADDWKGKYVRDVFGAIVRDLDGRPELADGFDEAQDNQYVPRLERKEWAAVGLMGKLVVCDDGSCVVNGFCRPGMDGVATAADAGYRVMRRVDETHVKILVK